MQGSEMMTGKLDEISSAIGALQANMTNIARSIDRDRDVGDRRHVENSGRLDKIERKLDPLDETVRAIKPIVDQYQISHWKIAGAAAVILPFIGFVGWLLWTIGRLIIDTFLARPH